MILDFLDISSQFVENSLSYNIDDIYLILVDIEHLLNLLVGILMCILTFSSLVLILFIFYKLIMRFAY